MNITGNVILNIRPVLYNGQYVMANLSQEYADALYKTSAYFLPEINYMSNITPIYEVVNEPSPVSDHCFYMKNVPWYYGTFPSGYQPVNNVPATCSFWIKSRLFQSTERNTGSSVGIWYNFGYWSIESGSNKNYFYIDMTNTSNWKTFKYTLADNVWHHMAFICDTNNKFRVYIDGVRYCDWTRSPKFVTSFGFRACKTETWIDDFVLIDNQVLWNDNFSVPTSPIVDDSLVNKNVKKNNIFYPPNDGKKIEENILKVY